MKAVSSEALSSLFELLSEQVTCVILNCCYSALQAKAIAEHINYVIGMRQEIGDEAAIVFATGFYKALGAGRSIKDAFNFGMVELKLLGIPEHLTPILLEKNIIKHMAVEEYDDNLHKDYASFTRNGQVVVLNPKAYNSIQSILDDLFIHYYSNFYSPYSYGEKWVLISHSAWEYDQILVPLEWMSNPGVSTHNFSSFWTALPSQQNVLPGSDWVVIEKKEITELKSNLIVIASNHAQLIKILLSEPKTLYSYIERSIHRSLKDFNSQKYKYIHILFDPQRECCGFVIEDDPEITQGIIEFFGRL